MTTREIRAPAAHAADNPVQVRGYTDSTNRQWVEVTYKGKVALLEYAQFAERAGVWSALSNKGCIFVRKADKASLIEQVEELEHFPPRVIFSRPGWLGGQFVNASGRVFKPAGEQAGAIGFTPDPTKCSRKGALKYWRSQVAMPLVGHPIPCFFIMVGFAAPMLELSGRSENIGYELAGEGGKGKSTCQRLMASLVGPAMEKDRGYITTFHMTPAALEKSMRWHSDMPFIIDEANLFGSGESGSADRRKMQDFAFQMASGVTKGRFDNPEQDGFRFVFVTSANNPFNEQLGESHRDVANAATDRLPSIVVPPGDPGVFGDLPAGYSSYREFTLALEGAMAQQYGSAMPKLLTKLVNARHRDEEKLKANIRRRIDKFKTEIGINENNGSDVRVAEAFGLVYAAGEFAKHHGILPEAWDCLEAAKHCYANFRSSVPIRQSLPERLLAIAKRPQTLMIDPQDLPQLSDAQVAEAGAFIREVKGETLLLMTTPLGQMMFPDWDALKGTPDFERLNRANDNRRGRGFHCRIRSNKRADWFYCFALPPEAVEQLSARANRVR